MDQLKKVASIMPYYTISWNIDKKNNKNQGNSYNIIKPKKNFFRIIDEEKYIVPVSEVMSEDYFQLTNESSEADVAIVFV